MGDSDGKEGVWAYIEGGMGKITQSLKQSAIDFGTEIITNATVKRILWEKNVCSGVEMIDGTLIHAQKAVISNATPYHTFLELLPGLSYLSGNNREKSPLPFEFNHHIRFADYGCGAFKINIAANSLPNFLCCPNTDNQKPEAQHLGTIHFETEMEELENAYREASMGIPASRPVIEMTIPSALDKTISPFGQHIIQLFIQFAPYDIDPRIGNWADPGFKQFFVQKCLDIIENHCPGFQTNIIGYDALSPLDLEHIFGLHKGNIFHGSLALHQLAYVRPINGYSVHKTPLEKLYLCGAGTHPGGGVMGAAGRNCAIIVMSELGMNVQL